MCNRNRTENAICFKRKWMYAILSDIRKFCACVLTTIAYRHIYKFALILQKITKIFYMCVCKSYK